MNCPYCNKHVYGLTGFMEAQKFQTHLLRCRKNPNNVVLRDGRRTVVAPGRTTFEDALKIRAESGQ